VQVLLVVVLGVVERPGRDDLGRDLGWVRFPLGPWWLWGIPVLTLALTIPMVGNPLKRAPLDPFLILIAAIGAGVAVEAVGSRLRAAVGRLSASQRARLIASRLLADTDAGQSRR
jgi:hypothetical protein